jgi:hypothetical protein
VCTENVILWTHIHFARAASTSEARCKNDGDFSQLRGVVFLARFQRPAENLKEMLAAIDGGMKEHNIRPVFRPAQSVLHGRATPDG